MKSVIIFSDCAEVGPACERSVGTVFQLPNPYAIYSRDEEEKRKVGGHPALIGLTHGPQAAGGRSDRRKEATRPLA